MTRPSILVTLTALALVVSACLVNGTAACNGYGGEYQLSGSSFSIDGGLSVTEMACGPPGVMDSERVFLEAIVTVDTLLLEEGRLVLTGEETELVFTLLAPVPTA